MTDDIVLSGVRYVAGFMYDAPAKKDKTTQAVRLDKEGNTLHEYWIQLAVAKQGEADWKQTAWGQALVNFARTKFDERVLSHPTFNWKVIDGDSSTAPEATSTPYNERDGFAGHWVLATSSSYAPGVYKMENGQPVQVLQKGFVEMGDYVDAQCSFGANPGDRSGKVGVYINHHNFCFRQKGERIAVSAGKPRVTASTFGASAALPANAALAPAPTNVGNFGGAATPVQLPSNVPSASAPIQPNPAVLQAPAATPQPPAPPAAPAQPVMTAKAAGASYQDFISQGWTDELLRANGYMV